MTITRPLRITHSASYDLGHIESHETLFLWRHRQRGAPDRLHGRCGAGMSQAEAALTLGLPWRVYSMLEKGAACHLTAGQADRLAAALAPVRPTQAELCLLARRRSGLNVTQVVEACGVSRPTYFRHEREGKVVEFWEERGFRFGM